MSLLILGCFLVEKFNPTFDFLIVKFYCHTNILFFQQLIYSNVHFHTLFSTQIFIVIFITLNSSFLLFIANCFHYSSFGKHNQNRIHIKYQLPLVILHMTDYSFKIHKQRNVSITLSYSPHDVLLLTSDKEMYRCQLLLVTLHLQYSCFSLYISRKDVSITLSYSPR